MDINRFNQQLHFITEIDRLKTVLRQTLLMDQSRRENSAEHSWHLALLAMILVEYAPEPIDLLRVMKMALLHDIVEIDAGDVFCYDIAANIGKAEREQRAADRIFGLLPSDQAQELRQLWDEFETQDTADAKFAAALDRLQPFWHNLKTEGGTWRIHGINQDQAMKRIGLVKTAIPELWPWVEQAIATAVQNGLLQPSEANTKP